MNLRSCLLGIGPHPHILTQVAAGKIKAAEGELDIGSISLMADRISWAF